MKNENQLLPLAMKGRIALIGPMADAANNMCGMWSPTCDPSRHSSLLERLRAATKGKAEILYAKGSNVYYDAGMEAGAVGGRTLQRGRQPETVCRGNGGRIPCRCHRCRSRRMCGNDRRISLTHRYTHPRRTTSSAGRLGKDGETCCGFALHRTSARPDLGIGTCACHPECYGSEEAKQEMRVADVLFGKTVPSGKLTTTFPRTVGQLPLYYSQTTTGRPDGDPTTFNRFMSNYIDCPNDGLYPFGYGLSYTTFEYGEMKLSSETLPKGGNITVTVPVKNTGNYDGTEIVQLYIHDQYADIARPVKELKDFRRITLKKGESQAVTFTLTEDDLKYYNAGLVYKYDAGAFQVMVGPNSRDVQSASFNAE